MTDTAPNDFTFFIKKYEPSKPFLPIAHMTDAFNLKKHILKEKMFQDVKK